jgi:hypothetical protein
MNFYFVAVDDDKDVQRKWYKELSPNTIAKFNVYFLKGKNLYAGCKKFLENSKIVHKHFFEVEDFTKLEDTSLFVQLIKEKRK